MALSPDILAMTFSDTSVSIDGMLVDSATIAGILREAKDRPAVVELTFRNVAIDRIIVVALEDLLLQHAESSNTKWQKLETIHCTGEIGAVIQAVTTNDCVQQFCFTGSVPIAHNPRYSLDTPSLQALGRAMQRPNSQTLSCLNLKGTRLTRQGLTLLADGLSTSSSLQTFRMSHCAMDAADLAILASALGQNKHLTVLLLAHCKLNGDDQADNFALLLESLIHHPTLECFNVYGMTCRPRATQALADMLTNSSSCRLWHLGLKNNLQNPEDKLQVTSLFQALRSNQTLTHLQVSGNNVHDDDMEPLADILAHHNTTLKGLGLTANNIGSAGLRSFATRLADMRGLRFLDVQRNPLDTQVKDEIIAALEHNMELERLDLDGTYHEHKSFYLGLNKGGRRLLLNSNAPLALWPLVLERAAKLTFGRNRPFAHLDVLYCLVRGPALFQPSKRRHENQQAEQEQQQPSRKKRRLDTTR
jgi:Ran GTPase-activating protein (RanGAP) involved in mRNA processing and transport